MSSGERRPLSRSSVLAGIAIALLAVVGLALQSIVAPVGDEPRASATVTAGPGEFPTGAPGWTPSLPTTVVAVGDQAVVVDGEGTRQVAYTVAGQSGITARLECWGCAGSMKLFAGDQQILDEGAPYDGEVDLNASASDRRTVLRVDADGPWRLTLRPS